MYEVYDGDAKLRAVPALCTAELLAERIRHAAQAGSPVTCGCHSRGWPQQRKLYGRASAGASAGYQLGPAPSTGPADRLAVASGRAPRVGARAPPGFRAGGAPRQLGSRGAVSGIGQERACCGWGSPICCWRSARLAGDHVTRAGRRTPAVRPHPDGALPLGGLAGGSFPRGEAPAGPSAVTPSMRRNMGAVAVRPGLAHAHDRHHAAGLELGLEDRQAARLVDEPQRRALRVMPAGVAQRPDVPVRQPRSRRGRAPARSWRISAPWRAARSGRRPAAGRPLAAARRRRRQRLGRRNRSSRARARPRG